MRAARTWLALGAAAWLACAAPAEERYREGLAETPEPARHGVAGRRLAELMRGLDELAHDRLPRALDVAALRAHRVDEVVDVARGLSEAAARIPAAADGLGLGGEERAAFAGLAATLERRAGALAADAPGLGRDALDARVRELQATCEDCHTRFRVAR